MLSGGPVFNVWLTAWLQVINSLTRLVWWAVQRLDTTILIPHQQFTACLHGYKGLEVDLTTVLHLQEVLFFVIACTVHKSHPVTVIFICSINNVADFSTFKNLANKHQKVTSCTGTTFKPISLSESVMQSWNVVVTFESTDEILWCNNSNETSSAVLSHGAIYLVCSSNFWVCGWNPMVLPFKWNLFSSTFTCYCSFSMYF